MGAPLWRGGASWFTPPPAPGPLRLGGRHVVVATSTASGKSLCYLVPLLQASEGGVERSEAQQGAGGWGVVVVVTQEGPN